jgi:hypothetical protein
MITFNALISNGQIIKFEVDRIYTNKRYSNYYSVPTDGCIYYMALNHKMRNGKARVTINFYRYPVKTLHGRVGAIHKEGVKLGTVLAIA